MNENEMNEMNEMNVMDESFHLNNFTTVKPKKAAPTREEILEKARQCVSGDRDLQYGSPEESFSRIAKYWSDYLDKDISPKDVAIMMILFKVAREEHSSKVDNWIDIAGYAACGGEITS